MEKICKKCNILKPFDEFYFVERHKDRRHPDCKACVRKYNRDRHNSNEKVRHVRQERHRIRVAEDADFRERHKDYARKFYKSSNGRAKTLFHSAQKSRAASLFPFELTLEYVRKGVDYGFCAVTGLKFTFCDTYQKAYGTYKNPFAPSIDRIDPKKGYTNENTRIVIWQYNLMKGELTDEHLIWLCRKVLGKYDGHTN